MVDLAMIEAEFQALSGRLDEATWRMWAATEARSLGRGGIRAASKAIGMSRTTIHTGLAELKAATPSIFQNKGEIPRRTRATGGGRKKLVDKDADLLRALDALVEPTSRGDPMSPLRWTCKSTYRLAQERQRQGHQVSQRTVCDLLRQMNYSLPSTRKTRKSGPHENRDAQFAHIARRVVAYQAAGDPVISVDTKQKERIGDFKNVGREWPPKGAPENVRVPDFVDPALGQVAPCGVYDLTAHAGWVNIGIDHDTAEFAVESIRRWWHEMGDETYAQARRLLITADCGGSNGHRVRLWWCELQKLADEMKMTIQFCHFPPGTRKWNKIYQYRS